jgi:hypothetical protein
MVRFADDFVVGFEHRGEAEQFLTELSERFAKFGLTLHPDKTRLLEFGRFADRDRRGRGDGKPETFDFLGFTHSCGKTRQGKFTVLRQTMRRRWQVKLKAGKAELRRRLHEPVPVVGAYLRSVVGGHVHYYGVPLNGRSIGAFRRAIGRLWWRTLKRRSRGHHLSWERMMQQLDRWLPPARICHPYRWCGLPLGPEAGAGCGSAARPDLWRGLRVTVIPTPTDGRMLRRAAVGVNGRLRSRVP